MAGIHKPIDNAQKKTGGEMKTPKLPEPAIELRIRPGAEEIPSKILGPYRAAMKEDKKAADAVKHISAANVDILADIAVYSLSEPACLAAANKIPSHEVDTLMYVKRVGAFASVRKAVAERLPKTEGEKPEEMAMEAWTAKADAIEATNAAEGMKALKLIPNEQVLLLLEIAQNANQVAVARAAVERINDPKALAKVAESRKEDDVGAFAQRKYSRILDHLDRTLPNTI